MYEFWYDYIKPKYGGRAKLCYMDTDSFIIHVERWFDTSNYDYNDKRLLPRGKNKKVIGLFKDELEGKIMTEFVGIRLQTYLYSINGYNNDDDYDREKIIRKAKGTKKCVIKEKYKKSLFNDQIILKSQQRLKSDHHKVYTEEVNKIALSNDDDKRSQTSDKITTNPHGTNIFKVYESEMVKVCEAKATLKMLSKVCESEMYVKEKEKKKCELFLMYVKAKCESEMRNYVKVKKC